MMGRPDFVTTAPRKSTGWVTYGPGPAKVFCPDPNCHTRLGDVGEGFIMKLRRNPNGRKQPPTHGIPYSEHCRRCDVNWERVAEPVRST